MGHAGTTSTCWRCKALHVNPVTWLDRRPCIAGRRGLRRGSTGDAGWRLSGRTDRPLIATKIPQNCFTDRSREAQGLQNQLHRNRIVRPLSAPDIFRTLKGIAERSLLCVMGALTLSLLTKSDWKSSRSAIAGLWPSPVARAFFGHAATVPSIENVEDRSDTSRTHPLIDLYHLPDLTSLSNQTWCHFLTWTLVLLIADTNEQYWFIY